MKLRAAPSGSIQRDAARAPNAMPDRARGQRQAGLQRVHAEHLLQVQRQEEHRRRQHAAGQRGQPVGDRDRPDAEHRQRDDRLLRPPFHEDEHGERGRGEHSAGERSAATPSPAPRRGSTGRTRAARADGDRERPGQVQAAADVVRRTAGQRPRRRDDEDARRAAR